MNHDDDDDDDDELQRQQTCSCRRLVQCRQVTPTPRPCRSAWRSLQSQQPSAGWTSRNRNHRRSSRLSPVNTRYQQSAGSSLKNSDVRPKDPAMTYVMCSVGR